MSDFQDLQNILSTTTGSLMCISDDPKYDKEKPYFYAGKLEASQEHLRTNLEYSQHDGIKFRDIRGFEEKVELSKHGFQIFKHASSQDLERLSEESILENYLLETSNLVKEYMGATHVLCYDYRFRKDVPQPEPEYDFDEPQRGTFSRPEEPANTPHVDQTKAGGFRRAQRHLTEEETEIYLSGRYRLRIINSWRPLKPVEDSPLAFCDYYSIAHSALVAADRVSPEYCGEVYYLKFEAEQQWYYLSKQKPDEISVFLSFDSHPNSGSVHTRLSAFRTEEGHLVVLVKVLKVG
ncbi:hypothetical protein EG329_001238 [Mollisiaceae sp. DMI_Dod_QoI]|nr:hypothetical protein EG329_001238 [Helotiales sp. DMI_Dod_QoI]